MTDDTTRQGVLLAFYTRARARHDGMLVSEWLLQQAKHAGLGGGSVFRAIAGFGRHGVLHEAQFFELADDLPVKVEFLLTNAQADALLQRARDAGVDAVYASTPASFGIVAASATGAK